MNKKLKEVALHEKDTGSSEAQIALLTDKIENLSAHMKKFKKDKHSSVGLLKAVNTRKKLLDYLFQFWCVHAWLHWSCSRNLFCRNMILKCCVLYIMELELVLL